MALTALWPPSLDPTTGQPLRQGWEVVTVDTVDEWFHVDPQPSDPPLDLSRNRFIGGSGPGIGGMLKQGQVTRFVNGQMWLLKEDKAHRVYVDLDKWEARPR